MDRLVAIAVSRRYLMVGLFAAVIVGGLIAFKQLNIVEIFSPLQLTKQATNENPAFRPGDRKYLFR
jgi:hypothetical protein